MAADRSAARRISPPLLCLLLILGTLCPNATSGTADIVIGQTTALTGTEGEYGRRLYRGLWMALDEANAAGGVQGRNLTLRVMDDAHNLTRAALNAQQLLTVHNATVLANIYGTDCLQAVMAVKEVAQSPVPLVGPYTGAPMTRSPFNEKLVNIRASTPDEIISLAAYLTETLQVHRIAYFSSISAFGNAALLTLRQALQYAGLQLVSYGQVPQFTQNMTAAVQAIVGAQARPQAIVITTVEAQTLAFLAAYRQHPLADPNCHFLPVSPSLAPTFSQRLSPGAWPFLHFSQVVPLPDDSSVPITQRVKRLCAAQRETPDVVLLEGYITGRLIVEVLRNIRNGNFTGASFLDQLYSTRLFVLDGLTLGPYSRDFPGCDASLCSCSTGLRSTFLATVNASGVLVPNMQASNNHSSFRYPITQCACTFADQIDPPLTFAQLVPQNDTMGRTLALDIAHGIQAAMEEANAAGTFGNRQLKLLEVEYSSDPRAALAALSDRYVFIASLGSVVPSALALRSDVPTVAAYQSVQSPQEDSYAEADLRVQPSTPLELMALASFAVQTPDCPIHLRSPSTGNGTVLLALMLKSVHTFQVRPASQRTYSPDEAPFSDITAGCVLLAADAAEVQRWYSALEGVPQVFLLTLSSVAARMSAADPTVASGRAADRLRFPTLFAALSAATTRNGTKSDSWLYGYVLVQMVSQALVGYRASQAYTTSSDLLAAWNRAKLLGFDGVSFGTYSNAQCADGSADSISGKCECNNGARTLALRSLASRTALYTYTATTCWVQYQPLREDPDRAWVLITGVAVGVGVAPLLLLLAWTYRGRRNNRAAPKDPQGPFCILFTDIQASTHLWATIPDKMASVLDAHHSLLRQLISSHGCYEVKTIGDSFMCAVQSPERAVGFALAVQTRLFEHDWGTTDVDNAYREQVPEEISMSDHCWNGLRVRIGIHFGHGDITLDPVSHGYDYYGTVVNTAARIESVCHGGQVGVSQAVHDALGGTFPNAVWTDLGPQLLRGLTEPIHLWQVLPAGELAKRRFPPLRIEKAHGVPQAPTDEVAPPAMIHSNVKANRISPTAASAAVVERLSRMVTIPSIHTALSDGWVDTHPLVENGTVSAGDLRWHHTMAMTTLSAVLATQTERFKEAMLRGLCERLHVRHVGNDGTALQRSLHGIVLRVLPSVVAALPSFQTFPLPHGDSLGRRATDYSTQDPSTPTECSEADTRRSKSII